MRNMSRERRDSIVGVINLLEAAKMYLDDRYGSMAVSIIDEAIGELWTLYDEC